MSSQPSTRTPSMRQIQRQPTIDGLYTIDPQDIGGMEAVPETPYMYKSLRPMTNEGLQAGIPTKHLAGLQISMNDFAPEHVEDESYGKPEYFERDGFKKWQSPAPKRYFGIRRRIFWLVLAVILLVLVAISIGIGVGLTAKQHNADKADAQAASSSSATTSSQTTTSVSPSSATISSSTSKTIATSPTGTVGTYPTYTWTVTTQLVPEFSGTLAVSATPTFYTTATVTAQAGINDTAQPTGGYVLNDCPMGDGTVLGTSLNMPFRKMCYQSISGATLTHKTSTATFDDCIESCALQNQNQSINNPGTCWAVTYTSNRTHTDGSQFSPSNCYMYGSQGKPGPGDYMMASAVLLDNGVDPGK